MLSGKCGPSRRGAAVLCVPLLLAVAAGCSADARAPGPEPSAPRPPSVTASAAPGPTPTPSSTQPSPGNITSEVPVRPARTHEAVALDQASDAGDGVRVEITRIDRLTAQAQGPGEVSGPALALTVRVENRSDAPLDLGNVVVTLTGADAAPGESISSEPADPLQARLLPGRTTSGVYVFTIGEDSRDPITVAVTLVGGGTVLLYTGPA